MNIWNKVFLGIIFATAIAVVVLTAVEMKIRGTGQKKIASLENKIDETNTKIEKITGGSAPTKASVDKSPAELSFEEIRGKSIGRFYERGRAWFGCLLDGEASQRIVPPKNSEKGQDIVDFIVVEVQVIITEPRINGKDGNDIDETVLPEALKGIVYVFEETANNSKETFLGRFRVSEGKTPEKTKFKDINDQEKNAYKVELVTIDLLNTKEIEHIEAAAARARKENAPNSRSSWAVYLTPPVDRVVGIFDQLTEEEKQAIPEELREKFLPRPLPELTEEEKQGQDPKVLALWEKYRAMRDDPEQSQDFSLALDWLFRRRGSNNRDIETALTDIETYKTAKEKSDAENKKMEEDCVLEEKRVDAMNINRDAVKKLRNEYDAEINKLTLQIEKLQALQIALVAKIAEYQMKAIEKIEEKTRQEPLKTATRNGE